MRGIKPVKTKYTAALLAFFLGTFGVHRFYLKQYKLGLYYLLSCWTPIPFVVSLVDAIVFLIMPKYKFDIAYNDNIGFSSSIPSNPLSNAVFQVCSVCGTEYKIIDKKQLEAGFIEENSKVWVCNDCANSNELSEQYFNMLREQSATFRELLSKLTLDTEFQETLIDIKIYDNDLLADLLIYDLARITSLVTLSDVNLKGLEATGLALVGNQVILKPEENSIFNSDFDEYKKLHEKGELRDAAKNYMNTIYEENTVNLTNLSTALNAKTNQYLENPLNLALGKILQHTNHPLFPEYATALYQFANVICKANYRVTQQEQKILKQIYTHTRWNNKYTTINNKRENSVNINKPTDKQQTYSTPKNPLDIAIHELNNLIGLTEVKREIATFINYIKIQETRKKSGLKTVPTSYHLIFTGNPGTGKTTVADIISKIYKELGVLKVGHLLEIDATRLIVEHEGETASKVNNEVNLATNGILFIDKAYAMDTNNNFGKEALTTLLTKMDENQDNLVVILAGYTKKMEGFINANPILASKFNRSINFPDYNEKELLDIFKIQCTKLDYKLTYNAEQKLYSIFKKVYKNRTSSFENGRYVQNLFEKVLEKQANRIAAITNLSREILTTISDEDISI